MQSTGRSIDARCGGARGRNGPDARPVGVHEWLLREALSKAMRRRARIRPDRSRAPQPLGATGPSAIKVGDAGGDTVFGSGASPPSAPRSGDGIAEKFRLNRRGLLSRRYHAVRDRDGGEGTADGSVSRCKSLGTHHASFKSSVASVRGGRVPCTRSHQATDAWQG